MPDALSYHIPRALLWGWHGSFEPWRSAVWQQVGLPVAGDASLQPGVFLGLGWLAAGWTTSVLAVGAAVAIAAFARSLGWGRRPVQAGGREGRAIDVRSVDPSRGTLYVHHMKAVEFAIELTGEKVVVIPPEIAAQLPSQGRARVIILTPRDESDAEWQRAAYEQFLRDDSPEDAVYDTY